MNQFYVSDEQSAKRCHESRNEQKPITVSGVDVLEDTVKPFTGIVQSVEDYGPSARQGRRWRVSMY
ncbi:hypothetical protein [Bradyrhizobium sp. NAS80.1]|uniref:hypothetical protein n=1 Tax=Bradyrhizobium sp. NAS80.1 TaxID=1680159 RepID=UPI001160F186|nr:hypothetical protein [Bradyrhizobium sp. NAS80.1]